MLLPPLNLVYLLNPNKEEFLQVSLSIIYILKKFLNASQYLQHQETLSISVFYCLKVLYIYIYIYIYIYKKYLFITLEN